MRHAVAVTTNLWERLKGTPLPNPNAPARRGRKLSESRPSARSHGNNNMVNQAVTAVVTAALASMVPTAQAAPTVPAAPPTGGSFSRYVLSVFVLFLTVVLARLATQLGATRLSRLHDGLVAFLTLTALTLPSHVWRWATAEPSSNRRDAI